MTLNVSLRVPDGIVLASDSLATFTQSLDQKMNVTTTCKKCNTTFEIKGVQTPPLTVPSSTWPYAQKMFPIGKRFGLATYGCAYINNRSIYNHIIELMPNISATAADDLDEMAVFVSEYFQKQVFSNLKKMGTEPTLLPDSYFALGFQLVGFKRDASGDPVPHTYVLQIGKAPKIEKISQLGAYVTGDLAVVTRLWGGETANYGTFSLQDAVDYAKFLIKTTADFQRFSGRLPTVGGEIDIALITNHQRIQWIAQKQLYRMLDCEGGKAL